MNTADSVQGALRTLIANRCYTDAGLAEGTNAATFKTAATATYTVNGIFYALSATDNLTFSAGHVSLPDGYTQLVTVCANAAGVSTYQGRAYKAETDVDGTTKYRGYDVTTLGQAGTVTVRKGGDLETYTSAFLASNVPDTVTPIGIIKVANASGSAFVYGTTDLGAASVTDTYFDISVTPANAAL